MHSLFAFLHFLPMLSWFSCGLFSVSISNYLQFLFFHIFEHVILICFPIFAIFSSIWFFQIWPFPIFSPYCIVLLFSTYVYSLVFPLVSSLVFFLSSSHSKLPFFCMFFFPIWFPIFFSIVSPLCNKRWDRKHGHGDMYLGDGTEPCGTKLVGFIVFKR